MHEFKHIPDLKELKALNPHLKACLFDMDGTLFDTEKLHARAIFELIELHHPGSHTIEEIEEFCCGKTDTVIFKAMKEKNLFNENSVVSLIDKKIQSYLSCIEKELEQRIFLPQLKTLLESIKSESIKIALVTSSDYESAVATLAKANLEKYFEFLITEESTEKNKPHPDPYVLASNKLGVTPIECAVFEDSETGIEAAKKFGAGALIAARWYNN